MLLCVSVKYFCIIGIIYVSSYPGFVFQVVMVMTPSLNMYRSIILNLNSILCHTSVALSSSTVPLYHIFMFRVTLISCFMLQ